MTAEQEEKISQFLSAAPRYRIVVDKSNSIDTSSIDVGNELSYYLTNNSVKATQLKMVVPDILQQLFRTKMDKHLLWLSVVQRFFMID